MLKLSEQIKDICEACAESLDTAKNKIKDITKALDCKLKGPDSGAIAKPIYVFMTSLDELKRTPGSERKPYGFKDSS